MMTKQIVLPNEVLLSKAVQTVNQGHIAIIPIKGNSMDPFICGGSDCVELYPVLDIKVGDIVLAKVNSEQYILHRVYSFNGKDEVILMGDGNLVNTEYCFKKDILAKALFIIDKKGKRKRLDTKSMIIISRIWILLLPARSFMLRLYRKFFR